MNNLCIAVDYDGTFTADPVLFSSLIQNAKGAGHSVYIVTARRETEESCDQINADLDHWGCQCPVIFTALASKIDTCRRRGIEIDIWVDDDPRAVAYGH